MAGGTPAAQVVVIQRGQVVVNQRIGVDQFQWTCRVFNAGLGVADSFRGGDRQNWTDSFPTGEQAVAHGAVDRRRLDRFRGNQAFQGGVDAGALVGQIFG